MSWSPPLSCRKAGFSLPLTIYARMLLSAKIAVSLVNAGLKHNKDLQKFRLSLTANGHYPAPNGEFRCDDHVKVPASG
jgi:hypothetical protein